MALKRNVGIPSIMPGRKIVGQNPNIPMKGLQMPGNMYVNNGNNVPAFPGQQMGLTPAEAKHWYNTEIRSKGFSFSGGTTTVKNVIDIPGDARRLIGFASLLGAWGQVSLKINQSIEVEDTDTGFTKIGDNKEFYRLDLPLTGRDTISLIITGYAGYTAQQFIFFFI